MGLDQEVTLYKKDDSIESEFWTWRKHPDLEGWMSRLFYEKGGEGEFNCKFVELEKDDILRLQNDIENDNLPYTRGFFFGESDGSEKGDDLAFCECALEELEKGNRLTYSSWW